MNPDSPRGRAFIIKHLRESLNLIEQTGVPRYVLLDALSSCMRELAVPKQSASHASGNGHHMETRNIEFNPGEHDYAAMQIEQTIEALQLIGPCADTVMERYDAGVTLSAFASHLAKLLLDFKDHGAEGAAISQGVIDNLVQTVKTGRSHLTEVQIDNEH